MKAKNSWHIRNLRKIGKWSREYNFQTLQEVIQYRRQFTHIPDLIVDHIVKGKVVRTVRVYGCRCYHMRGANRVPSSHGRKNRYTNKLK